DALDHARDESAVDLDLVEGEAAQVAERRIARAEIVHRNAHAKALELVEDRERAIAVLHEDPLGDLELEAIGRQTGYRQNASDRFVQIGSRELDRRQVDRNTKVARPGARSAARLGQRPLTELQDQAGVFRYRDEHTRWDHASHRMVPPRKRFKAGDD